MKYIKLYIIGLCMGIADIIPGVSGGTIAFVSGIYEKLLSAIKVFNFEVLFQVLKFEFKAVFSKIPFNFLIPLFAGIFSAVLIGSKIIKSLLVTNPSLVFTFFAGLILASAYIIAKRANWSKIQLAIFFLLSVSIYIAFDLLRVGVEASHSLPTLFISGMIAISAMILPGISGSFILLILGQYEYILNAVTERNFLVLITVALGCGFGLFFSVRVVSFLLNKFRAATIIFLCALMTGSMQVILKKITSNLVINSSADIIYYGILFILGFISIFIFDKYAALKAKDTE